MKLIRGFIVFFVFFTSYVFAIEVVFFEKRDESGEIVRLEEKGRFYHLAIHFGDCWLHTDTYRGVVCDKQVDHKYGEPVARLNREDFNWDVSKVHELMGKPYDRDYLWGDDKIYCSELVAILFGLLPVPMKFDGNYWKSFKKQLPVGEPGMSPDGVFSELKALGFNESCESSLSDSGWTLRQ